MKNQLLTWVLTALSFTAGAQNKTKNVILISIDGYRWQEIFRGADSTLLFSKKYRQQDSAAMVAKYWAKTPGERRVKLMPFFWGTIAGEGSSTVTATWEIWSTSGINIGFRILEEARPCVAIMTRRSIATTTQIIRTKTSSNF